MVAGEPGHEKPSIRVVSTGLGDLHSKLFEQLVMHGVEFSHPEYLGPNYTPHYRETKEDPFEQDNEIAVTDIAVIRNLTVVGLDSGVKEITYRKLGQWSNVTSTL